MGLNFLNKVNRHDGVASEIWQVRLYQSYCDCNCSKPLVIVIVIVKQIARCQTAVISILINCECVFLPNDYFAK